jgi:hypothetical protein
MKYFLDTEFIEGFHKPLFGKKRHFIDLISIAIVCEDGRKYYAVSNEYNYKDADSWVKENVLLPLYRTCLSGDIKNRYDVDNFQSFIGLPNKRIAEEVLLFMGCWRDEHFWRVGKDVPEVYGYYADYDWVLFCSLFGRMIDLPKGFPMYCKDLKQMIDAKVDKYNFSEDTSKEASILESIKSNPNYPKQENEHSALDDAKWNFKLYNFLQTL